VNLTIKKCLKHSSTWVVLLLNSLVVLHIKWDQCLCTALSWADTWSKWSAVKYYQGSDFVIEVNFTIKDQVLVKF